MKGGRKLENTGIIVGRSKAFAIRIIKACSFLDEKPGVCRTLSKQLLRCGTSIEEGRRSQVGGRRLVRNFN